MAGTDPVLKMLVDLHQQGWTVIDMAEYEPNIASIASWCRTTLGDMLINPDVDISRWFGAVIPFETGPAKCFFAFRNPADYTLFQLRWA